MATGAHLFTIFKNLLRMMEIRGYDVSQYKPMETYTPAYFESNILNGHLDTNPFPVIGLLETENKTVRTKLCTFFNRINRKDDSDRCVVYFASAGESTVSKRQDSTGHVPKTEVETFARLMLRRDLPSSSYIFISSKPLTHDALNRINDLKNTKTIFVQTFLDEELMFSPLDSIWGASSMIEEKKLSNPRILTDDEAKVVLSKVAPGKMPKVLIDDPIAKYLGAREHQIIEYIRDNVLPEMLFDTEIFYRYVAPRPREKKKSVKAPAKTTSTYHV